MEAVQLPALSRTGRKYVIQKNNRNAISLSFHDDIEQMLLLTKLQGFITEKYKANSYLLFPCGNQELVELYELSFWEFFQTLFVFLSQANLPLPDPKKIVMHHMEV